MYKILKKLLKEREMLGNIRHGDRSQVYFYVQNEKDHESAI